MQKRLILQDSDDEPGSDGDEGEAGKVTVLSMPGTAGSAPRNKARLLAKLPKIKVFYST